MASIYALGATNVRFSRNTHSIIAGIVHSGLSNFTAHITLIAKNANVNNKQEIPISVAIIMIQLPSTASAIAIPAIPS